VKDLDVQVVWPPIEVGGAHIGSGKGATGEGALTCFLITHAHMLVPGET
jgi:hypothetical protein